MLSVTKLCSISHCFIQSPLLFTSLRVFGPTLTRSTPIPNPNSALQSPLRFGCSFGDFVCFSIALYALSTCWSAYPEWGTCTLINNTRCLFTVIDVAMARSLTNSVQLILLGHFLFSNVPTPCWFSNFPVPMNMSPWCVSQISAFFDLHDSLINRTSHLYPCTS